MIGVGVPAVYGIFFSSPHCPDRQRSPHSPQKNGYRSTFLGGKSAGREADHSPPSIAGAKE